MCNLTKTLVHRKVPGIATNILKKHIILKLKSGWYRAQATQSGHVRDLN